MSMGSFDDRAATWDDDPTKRERAEAVGRGSGPQFLSTRPCGCWNTALVQGSSRRPLRDSVGPVTMADTSAGMRDVMEHKVASGTIRDARVWDIDLATQPAPDERFELVVTVMTLHHISQLGRVLAGFASLLVDGGHLCIVDLEEEDGSFHGHDFDGHHGFSHTALASSLRQAGFVGVEFQPCHHVIRDSVTYPLFLATCTRRTADRASDHQSGSRWNIYPNCPRTSLSVGCTAPPSATAA